jgi:thioredoxin 1
MAGEPVDVTEAAFEKMVVQSELPVVVYFWAVWCEPCKMVAPILKKIAADFADRLLVVKVDVDTDSRLASQYGVQGIPTLLFMTKGVEVHRQVGTAPEEFVRDMAEELLTAAATKPAN